MIGAQMKLNLSLGQMDVSLGEPEVNFERVRGWTAEAARRGSDLVLFPELWSTGYDLEHWDWDKLQAMNQIETAPYLVANVLLQSPIERDFTTASSWVTACITR